MTAATLTTPLAGITDAKLMYEALARKLHNVALDVSCASRRNWPRRSTF